MDLYFLREADMNYTPSEVVTTGFGYAQAEKGVKDYFDYSVSTVALLLEGEVQITGEDLSSTRVTAGNMACFPKNVYHNIDILEDCTAVFLYILGDNVSFCEKVLTRESLDHMPVLDHRIHTLPIVPILRTFADQITMYIRDRQRLCRDISFIKQRELRALMSVYYSQSQLRTFLAPLFRTSDTFYSQVMSMAVGFPTVAVMARRLHMSRSTFLRRFQDNFNETPKEWATRLKCRFLYRALRETNEPMASIACRLRFCTLQRMAAFSKHHLGLSPHEIREGKPLAVELR